MRYCISISFIDKVMHRLNLGSFFSVFLFLTLTICLFDYALFRYLFDYLIVRVFLTQQRTIKFKHYDIILMQVI